MQGTNYMRYVNPKSNEIYLHTLFDMINLFKNSLLRIHIAWLGYHITLPISYWQI